jgi:hypothetical protein
LRASSFSRRKRVDSEKSRGIVGYSESDAHRLRVVRPTRRSLAAAQTLIDSTVSA